MADFLARLSGFWVSPFQDRFASFLWCIYIAILLAVLYAVYKNRICGVLLETLQKNDCVSTETAKTLEELGLEKNRAVLLGLKRDSSLRKIISFEVAVKAKEAAPDVNPGAEQSEKQESKMGLEKAPGLHHDEEARLWIPPEKAEKAAYLARGEKIGIGEVLIAVFGFYALIVASYYVLPLFIDGIDTFFR